MCLDRVPARRLAPLLLLAALAVAAGCGSTKVGMERRSDEYEGPTQYQDTMSPDAFVDRLGEPDEWKSEGEGDQLRMIAIWNCLKGERREVTWRIGGGEAPHPGWTLISDKRTEGKCP
jgi:hypothetical protein